PDTPLILVAGSRRADHRHQRWSIGVPAFTCLPGGSMVLETFDPEVFPRDAFPHLNRIDELLQAGPDFETLLNGLAWVQHRPGVYLLSELQAAMDGKKQYQVAYDLLAPLAERATDQEEKIVLLCNKGLARHNLGHSAEAIGDYEAA